MKFNIQNCNLKSAEFFIPNIKLVGYGRSQTYQCVCLKCRSLHFNLNKIRTLEDLFCDWCEVDEKYLEKENISEINYLGIIVGWEIKSSNDCKKRSFYNYKKVYKRDRYTCQYCNYSFENAVEFRPLHIDHIMPWSASGSNRMDNLCVACSKCNLYASNKWFHSFQEKKEFILKNEVL